MTIQNDQISYVKHVLAPFYVFFTLFGCWEGEGGLPRGLGRNLLMRFSRLSTSKMEISETDFFDTLTIQNDQISHAKHVLAPLYAFFTLFWVLGGGVASKGSREQPAYATNGSPSKEKPRDLDYPACWTGARRCAPKSDCAPVLPNGKKGTRRDSNRRSAPSYE